MIRTRTLACLTLLLALAVSVSEARRPVKKSGSQPRGDCKTQVDSLVRLYEAGDPTYLTWDISSAKCDSSQLYTAYYYQGIGFLFISAWKEALYFLSAARDIGGPKDEEILYHLWTVYRKLERYQEMERLTLELHQRYPSSLFLMEILDQWKSVKSPARSWSWGYSSKAAWASSPYLDHILTNRVRAVTEQRRGKHLFRETGSTSFNSKWNDGPLQGFQANLGGEWDYKGFSASADWGIGYESRKPDTSSILVTSGSQSFLVDSNWNFAQARLALGYSLTTDGGWNLAWNASAYQLSSQWRVLGLNHVQSFLFPNFILFGIVDVQKHWIGIPKDSIQLSPPPNPIYATSGLDGLYTVSVSITPYFSFGRHSLGIGPNYYATGSHTSGEYTGGLRFSETDWEHSVTATASYGFDLRHWCRLSLSGSYGYEFNSRTGSSGYSRKDVYGVDAGFSLSY
jgi:hypothetical protein